MRKQGLCPHCDNPIDYNDLYEIIKCPWCRDCFHPEFVKRLPRDAERKTEDDSGTGS